MSRGTRYAVGGAAALMVVTAVLLFPRIKAPDPVGVGFEAPEFTATRLSDPTQVARLSEYRGSVVLVNVWATWCHPCRREMPSIEKLYQGAEADIRDFVREYGLTFEIAHDPTGGIQQTYQLIGVPESFLIDKDGVIRKKTFETDWYSSENRELVARLLGN